MLEVVAESPAQKPPRTQSGMQDKLVPLASLAIAALSVVLSYRSLSLSAAQTQVAVSSLAQSRQAEDLRFIGRVSIQTDAKHRVIHVTNTGDSALVRLGVWSVGENRSAQAGNSLDLILARLPGLSACTSLSLSFDELRKEAQIVTTPYDAQQQREAETYGEAAVQDVFATFQAPSGRWYTVSDGGSLEEVQLSPLEESGNRIIAEDQELFAAMGDSDGLAVIGDTLAEGADVQRLFVTEIEADNRILEGVPRAIATYPPNNCE